MVDLNWKGKSEKIFEKFKDTNTKPFQTIETYQNFQNQSINFNIDQDWSNYLLWGDNFDVMANLLRDFSGKINLIYIDPPFATGGDFNLKVLIGDLKETNKTTQWINKKAYQDSWKEGIESYLNFMYERLYLTKELLSENGSIYIHLNWHLGHYIKIIMDELFGIENFKNEIIFAYPAASVQTRRFFMRSYDIILFYTKSDNYIFNDDEDIYMEYSNRVKNALKKDDKGIFYYRGGSHNGKKLSQKVYVENKGIFPRDVWNDIPYVRANTIEYQGFSTQKPERLLKRIILASSNENDIVADFFCGSGTTLLVAEKLNRHWIGCDINKHAIDMTKKRILDVQNSNDLYIWKNKYAKSPNPFKVVKLNTIENRTIVAKEFLIDNKNEDKTLKISENPNFTVDLKIDDNNCVVELINYTVPFITVISDEIKNKITSFSDWIDYWAVDFDNQNNIFDIKWISYRTPKNRKLELSSISYVYDKSSSYIVLIKVIDIFGIETIQNYNLEIH